MCSCFCCSSLINVRIVVLHVCVSVFVVTFIIHWMEVMYTSMGNTKTAMCCVLTQNSKAVTIRPQPGENAYDIVLTVIHIFINAVYGFT